MQRFAVWGLAVQQLLEYLLIDGSFIGAVERLRYLASDYHFAGLDRPACSSRLSRSSSLPARRSHSLGSAFSFTFRCGDGWYKSCCMVGVF